MKRRLGILFSGGFFKKHGNKKKIKMKFSIKKYFKKHI